MDFASRLDRRSIIWQTYSIGPALSKYPDLSNRIPEKKAVIIAFSSLSSVTLLRSLHRARVQHCRRFIPIVGRVSSMAIIGAKFRFESLLSACIHIQISSTRFVLLAGLSSYLSSCKFSHAHSACMNAFNCVRVRGTPLREDACGAKRIATEKLRYDLCKVTQGLYSGLSQDLTESEMLEM
jgi:hypothetical protein